jgi:LPXTG-site transpeptidase (sortase) family protein
MFSGSEKADVVDKKSKHWIYLVLVALVLVAAIGGGIYYLRKDKKSSSAGSASQMVQKLENSTKAKVGNETQPSKADLEYASSVNSINEYPTRLKIASIGVDAEVVALGIDTEGRVEVTGQSDLARVSWFQPGGAPGYGNKAPALFSGHFSGADPSQTAVFDELDKIKEGDEILVSTSGGPVLSYKVTLSKNYEVKDVPMNEILSPDGRDRIEIITCGGAWNSAGYTNRTVVTAIRAS